MPSRGPRNDTSAGFKSVFAVNGISGEQFSIRNTAQSSTGKVLSILKFTNDADTNVTMSTSIISDDGDFYGNSKIGLAMDGDGTQILKCSGRFSGGVTMLKGTLLMGSKLGRDSTGKNASGTLFTHGDLEMKGGTFGFYNDTSTTTGGTFSFNNIYWNDGVIKLVAYENGVDKITLDQLAGEGGTFMAGSGTVKTVVFEFTDYKDLFVGGNEYQIISWSDYDKSLTYQANDIYDVYNNKNLKANFRTAADGLYVSYAAAVPEPAIFASVLGAFALVLAAYRRRK